MIHTCSPNGRLPGFGDRPTSLEKSRGLGRKATSSVASGHFEDGNVGLRVLPSPCSIVGLTLVAAVTVFIAGCGTSDETASDVPPKMVFVDVKTGEAKALPATAEVPVMNPDTGRRTMMPAMYCETCAKWYPVPPAEQLNRAKEAGMCPQHKTPLKAEGPMP